MNQIKDSEAIFELSFDKKSQLIFSMEDSNITQSTFDADVNSSALNEKLKTALDNVIICYIGSAKI